MANILPLRAVLRNGETVLIREIGPADRPQMQDGFAKLSSQSRLFRFLAPHKELSEAELDHFTEPNSDTHFAIGAASTGVDTEMPIATARFIRAAPDAPEAEFAITIIDSHQRLGLGGLLLRTLARAAVERGVERFTALLHSENTAMQALMRAFGGRRQGAGQEEHWVLPLPLKPEPTLSRQPSEVAIWT